MVGEQLQAILKSAQAKTEKDGFAVLPEGTTATLYASHGGVGLTILRVEATKLEGPMLTARTTKRETYTLEVADVFAVAVEGNGPGPTRRAGFG